MAFKHFILCILQIGAIYGQMSDDMSIMDIINATAQLSEFGKVLRYAGLHQAFLDRTITLFVPTNDAMLKYKGKKDENLALNHLANVAIMEGQLDEKIVSLVTGSPPIWITRRRSNDGQTGTFVNQAQIIQADIVARTSRGDQQIMHVIDSVLEPLVPISLREAQYLVNLNAKKLLTRSSLYDLSGYRLRVFNSQAEVNQRTQMFGVAGQHTFFLPVDGAFEVNVELTGYDYERNTYREKPSSAQIDKNLVDARVVESHIVPHQLLFTSQAPTNEYQTVAWIDDGVKVNVSLQPASLQTTNDLSILNNYRNQDSFVYNKYQQEDRPDDPQFDPRNYDAPVMVRSNTIQGDRVHARGMVVARVLKGNIPVSNGVVHLIDKPLMIVARTLYEYISEEGRLPGNRLSRFAKLLRDKGGKFAEALLEAKDGTVLAPSDEAFEKVDRARLDFIIGDDYLRSEMLGLHFVRERLTSNDFKLEGTGESTYSTPASLAINRVWFQFNPRDLKMTVAARGVNASVVEKDIGTINGVIHVIDRVLGIPHQTIYQRLSTDPDMSHMWSMMVQTRMDQMLLQSSQNSGSDPYNYGGGRQFTLVVPSNAAWEKAQMNFHKAYNTLTDGQFPQYTVGILQRHLKSSERGHTFEELVELTRGSPRRSVDMMIGRLEFTQLGEFNLNAYKDNFVALTDGDKVRGKVFRPNIECIDGYIHMTDTVMLDDSPPWTAISSDAEIPKPLIFMALISGFFTCIFIY